MCDQETAVVMFTQMDTGDTASVGAACLPGFTLTLAATMSHDMPPETAAQYGDLFDAIAANDSRPKSSDASRADSGSKRAKSAPPSGQRESAQQSDNGSAPATAPIDAVEAPL